nr:TAP domain-containing protein [Colletotrichum truncatum]KAF6792834.1 TAP domain-containing protein [Colletotrichum truncatum]
MHFQGLPQVLRLSPLLLGGALAGLASATTQSAESEIQWKKCEGVIGRVVATGLFPPIPVECSNLTVPIDYSEPDNGTFELPLIRMPALKQPSKGSIIVHFGGPAPLQTTTLVTLGEQMLLGTQGTALELSCFNTTRERELWNANTGGITALTTEDKLAFGRSWVLAEKHAQICADNNEGKRMDVIGTVDTVRDVMSIVDALGGDRRVRFYGISYGTIVGATLGAMFPDRIERLVLDGVSNIHQWWAGEFWEMQTDSDKVLAGFVRTCFEKPELCPLAAANPNSTAEHMTEKIYEMMEELKFNPIPILDDSIPGVHMIDDGFVKSMMRGPLYNAAGYPTLAALVHLLMIRDLEKFIPIYNEANPVTEYGDSSMGITCSDTTFRAETVEDALPRIEKNIEISRFIGDMMHTGVALCSQWKLPLKERFTRGFHEPVELQTPPLLIGNEYDVVTPHVSAVNASASFPGSSVVKFNTFGHGIQSQPSLCTANIVREYFENGKLPEDGTVCEPAAHPWENTKWDPLFKELDYVRPSNGTGSNSTAA